MTFEDIKAEHSALAKLARNPIAYFCAEYALSDELPIYSGGLGVLAADVIREAAASGLPLVGVGLFYKQGYFTQVITESGVQDELPAYHDATHVPIQPVLNPDGSELHIKLYVSNRIIKVRVWQYREAQVSVYLLDTDVPENQDLDRRLTLSLYPTDNEWRIQQEIVLGLGGVKLLNRLGLTPSVYHLNEGHSAFAILEIAHQHMKQTSLAFPEALAYARSRTVFTNHTLIPSGNDVFNGDVVRRLLGEYAEHLGFPVNQIVNMGAVPNQPELFSMTHLALKASKLVSAVSKTHAQFARVTWPDVRLMPITNGVCVPYWQGSSWRKVSDELARGLEVSDGEMWRIHSQYKAELLEYVRETTGRVLHNHVLTLTWARRIAAYKQPLLIFSDIARLKAILKNSAQPVQIILAGKAHPGDGAAKAMITEMLKLLHEHGLTDNVVFVPNYNLGVARVLVGGSDVWLNTPIKGQEACGTSGMKSAVNGGLQFAISDGWTDEIDLHKLGFSISPIDSATSFYNLLEQVVVPLYYQKNAEGLPSEWIARMRETILVVARGFSSERMMRDYAEQLYKPIVTEID